MGHRNKASSKAATGPALPHSQAGPQSTSRAPQGPQLYGWGDRRALLSPHILASPGSMGTDVFGPPRSEQEAGKTLREQLLRMKRRLALPPLQETPQQQQRPTLTQTLYKAPCPPGSRRCPALSPGRAARRLQIPACRHAQTGAACWDM